MRSFVFTLTLIAAVSLLAACTSTEQSPSGTVNSNTSSTAPAVQSTRTANTAPGTESAPPVAAAHGGGAPQSANPSAASEEPTGIDTSALDAKIAQAEEKAKANSATAADKLAAAAAYKERADIFMNAGRPALYKFALRDYRRTLRYQPDNEQARKSMDTIVSIYQSMGRPVPQLGNEP